MEHHHVEQQVLHLQNRAVLGGAIRVHRLTEIQRIGGKILPSPLFGCLGLQRLSEILLGDFAIFRLGRIIRHKGRDQVFAIVKEVQGKIGRHAILLAIELHGLENGITENLAGIRRQINGLHIGRIFADRIGGNQVHVKSGAASGQIDLQLVKEPVA